MGRLREPLSVGSLLSGLELIKAVCEEGILLIKDGGRPPIIREYEQFNTYCISCGSFTGEYGDLEDAVLTAPVCQDCTKTEEEKKVESLNRLKVEMITQQRKQRLLQEKIDAIEGVKP